MLLQAQVCVKVVLAGQQQQQQQACEEQLMLLLLVGELAHCQQHHADGLQLYLL
jgi:hypothetical protein